MVNFWSPQDSEGEKIFDFLRFAQYLTGYPGDALPGSDVWRRSPAPASMPGIVPAWSPVPLLLYEASWSRQAPAFCKGEGENAIRPFAVDRKNWLFSNYVEGANASAVVYTMVEMAKVHNLNIYGYLKFLLEHRPNQNMTDEQLAELAPWSEKLQAIKNRMWIIVNYSNSQRAGVILNFTALLFGAYVFPAVRSFS